MVVGTLGHRLLRNILTFSRCHPERMAAFIAPMPRPGKAKKIVRAMAPSQPLSSELFSREEAGFFLLDLIFTIENGSPEPIAKPQ